MFAYRLYCLRGGKIVRGDYLEADGDAQAIAKALAQDRDMDCELWLGGRLVAQLPLNGEPIVRDDTTEH